MNHDSWELKQWKMEFPTCWNGMIKVTITIIKVVQKSNWTRSGWRSRVLLLLLVFWMRMLYIIRNQRRRVAKCDENNDYMIRRLTVLTDWLVNAPTSAVAAAAPSSAIVIIVSRQCVSWTSLFHKSHGGVGGGWRPNSQTDTFEYEWVAGAMNERNGTSVDQLQHRGRSAFKCPC